MSYKGISFLSPVVAEGEGILEIAKTFTPKKDADTVTVRIDRNSKSLPFIYTLMTK